MKRILLTIGRLTHGGAEMRLLQLLRAMYQRDVSAAVTIYVVSGREGPLDAEFRAAGAEILYGRPGVRGLIEIVRLCRRVRFDIFHANASLAGGIYCFAAWVANVPFRVSHIRSTGYDEQGWARSMRNWLYRRVLNRFSDKVIGVCNQAQGFAGTPSNKWLTIYNGVECQDSVPELTCSREMALCVLVLGRIDTPKNPFRVPGIAEALKRELAGSTFRIDMIGGGSETILAALADAVDSRGLHDIIHLPGPTNDPMSCLRGASVLLLPSTREGLPGVVLEALSCGTPVVASRLPGVEEIAEATEGVTVLGLERPDPEWAQALITAALRNNRTRVAMAFKASPFTFENHYEKMLTLWGVEVTGRRSERLPAFNRLHALSRTKNG